MQRFFAYYAYYIMKNPYLCSRLLNNYALNGYDITTITT